MQFLTTFTVSLDRFCLHFADFWINVLLTLLIWVPGKASTVVVLGMQNSCRYARPAAVQLPSATSANPHIMPKPLNPPPTL